MMRGAIWFSVAQNRRAKLADRIRMSRSSAIVALHRVAMCVITHGEITRIGQTADGDVVAMTGRFQDVRAPSPGMR